MKIKRKNHTYQRNVYSQNTHTAKRLSDFSYSNVLSVFVLFQTNVYTVSPHIHIVHWWMWLEFQCVCVCKSLNLFSKPRFMYFLAFLSMKIKMDILHFVLSSNKFNHLIKFWKLFTLDLQCKHMNKQPNLFVSTSCIRMRKKNKNAYIDGLVNIWFSCMVFFHTSHALSVNFLVPALKKTQYHRRLLD